MPYTQLWVIWVMNAINTSLKSQPHVWKMPSHLSGIYNNLTYTISLKLNFNCGHSLPLCTEAWATLKIHIALKLSVLIAFKTNFLSLMVDTYYTEHVNAYSF